MSLYCESNEQDQYHHLNHTKVYGNQRAELSCENLHSNFINTLLNRTMTINAGNIGNVMMKNSHQNQQDSILGQNNHCVSASKCGGDSNNNNNTFIKGSCDYTSDRTLQEPLNIKSPSSSSNVYCNVNGINSHIPSNDIQMHIDTNYYHHHHHNYNKPPMLNHPSSTNNNNNPHKNLFSPIYAERNISFSNKELNGHINTTNSNNSEYNNYNCIFTKIEGILNNSINSISYEANSDLLQCLTQKVKRLNEEEQQLNSQSNYNNQLNDKLRERENILKRERNKLEEKCRKYKTQQGEFETKSLNLAQNNLQFENDQYRFMLEKEIYQHDKENYINMNLLLSHDLHMPMSSFKANHTDQYKEENELGDSFPLPFHRKSINGNKNNTSIAKKKKDVMLENASNYKIKEYKSKPNSNGSATNYTSGNNSDTMSNDYQNGLYSNSNTQVQELSITLTNNNKFIAPIAEIDLLNKQQHQQEPDTKTDNDNSNNDYNSSNMNECLMNNNPLIDSLECGLNTKKLLPANSIGRSALRKNSKQCVNNASSSNNNNNNSKSGPSQNNNNSNNNSNHPRKKSIKINTNNPIITTNRKVSIIAPNTNIIKGGGNILTKNNAISNSITPVSSSNTKHGIKINKKFK